MVGISLLILKNGAHLSFVSNNTRKRLLPVFADTGVRYGEKQA